MDDFSAIKLSLKLASLTSLFLLLTGLPLAFWLSRKDTWPRRLISSLCTLPLVLPPTVLGFYLLFFLSPESFLGRLSQALGLGNWAFTFKGLVLASIIYSMPFVIGPLTKAFEALGFKPLEVAASLGVPPHRAFFNVLLPQIKPSIIVAAIMCFAHTLGEFGVVLMIGGNIPGVSQVLSIEIYGHVEAMDYERAHLLSAGLLVFSLVSLIIVQMLGPKKQTKSDA